MCAAYDLEQAPHAGAARAGEAIERSIDLGHLQWRYCLTQHRGAAFDSKVAQERSLVERTENARTHALSGLGQRLEIDVCGEVDGARRLQRIGVGMLADRLQRIA